MKDKADQKMSAWKEPKRQRLQNISAWKEPKGQTLSSLSRSHSNKNTIICSINISIIVQLDINIERGPG
jgi:hypothetical protein